jgi:hypothetical protein
VRVRIEGEPSHQLVADGDDARSWHRIEHI